MYQLKFEIYIKLSMRIMASTGPIFFIGRCMIIGFDIYKTRKFECEVIIGVERKQRTHSCKG